MECSVIIELLRVYLVCPDTVISHHEKANELLRMHLPICTGCQTNLEEEDIPWQCEAASAVMLALIDKMPTFDGALPWLLAHFQSHLPECSCEKFWEKELKRLFEEHIQPHLKEVSEHGPRGPIDFSNN